MIASLEGKTANRERSSFGHVRGRQGSLDKTVTLREEKPQEQKKTKYVLTDSVGGAPG